MLRNGAVFTDLHQFMKQGFGVLFGLHPVAGAIDLRRALGFVFRCRECLRKFASKLLQSFQTARIEAHEQPRVSRV